MTEKRKPRGGYSVNDGNGSIDSDMEFKYEWIKHPDTLEKIKNWKENFAVIQITEGEKVRATIVAKAINKGELCIFTGESVEATTAMFGPRDCFPIGGKVV